MAGKKQVTVELTEEEWDRFQEAVNNAREMAHEGNGCANELNLVLTIQGKSFTEGTWHYNYNTDGSIEVDI